MYNRQTTSQNKRSLQDGSLKGNITDEPLTFKILPGASQKGSDLLRDSMGYSYTVKDRPGRCTRWQCSVRNKSMRCNASVRERDGGFQKGSVDHIHAPNLLRKVSAKIVKQAKEDGSQDLFTSTKEIVAYARNTVGEDFSVNEKCLVRHVNRKRTAMRPKEPKDMDFLVDTHAVPTNFLREDLLVDGCRHLIFATDNQIEALRKSARWYVDGTFKCMRLPFARLLTIQTFVQQADGSKHVPLIYVFMTSRKTKDYIAVFESIRDRITKVKNIQEFVIDYEKALWKAARHCFPDVHIKGCAYHWGQAVWGHVQQLGLTTQYIRDTVTHVYIRKLLSLPFLPEEHIRPTFEHMKDFNSCEVVNPLLEYLDRHWFGSTVWTVSDWCVYGQSIRTNNDVEGWHRRLNYRSGASPPFYTLIGILHRQSKQVTSQILPVSELALRQLQRRSYRDMQAPLFAAWDSYAEGSLSISGLLKKVADIYGRRVTRPQDDV